MKYNFVEVISQKTKVLCESGPTLTFAITARSHEVLFKVAQYTITRILQTQVLDCEGD